MDFQIFTQLGIAGVSLGIIALVVKFFIKTIEQKDQYIKELVDNHICKISELTDKYYKTITEYVSAGNASRQENRKIIEEVLQEIKSLKKL